MDMPLAWTYFFYAHVVFVIVDVKNLALTLLDLCGVVCARLRREMEMNRVLTSPLDMI